ncbi:MAG TPA: rhodanese-like domain-containing protein [Flavobacterium sp.]|uniref:rhodanese-like domain-containing protein n=1 Tax=Flavobacterium sp. TaxID=239 RepID=UPI002B4ADB65|nr:rhodanese-like domain-containing protein [Flavobacterium sp.]HLO73115.1 rhodanese-like domain-containing protein [Flavobacterium sp.]
MNLEQKEWWSQFLADENGVLIDVRTEDEYNDGSIPNAINIDIYKGQGFIYKVEELDKSKNYYVYCAAGARSSQACGVMQQLGFENTYNLLGGFSNWEGPRK